MWNAFKILNIETLNSRREKIDFHWVQNRIVPRAIFFINLLRLAADRIRDYFAASARHETVVCVFRNDGMPVVLSAAISFFHLFQFTRRPTSDI